MKAAQINDYGTKEVLQITDVADKPTVADDQVLVTVHASGVNPFDVTVREGRARQMAELTFPATLGGDTAGIIAELGSSVTGFQIGEEVYGQAGALSGHGSFAEFTPVKAGSLAVKPTSVDFITAAALPLAGSSAYQALVDHMNLQPDQKILIHGGAGGIGSMAIQLAKHLGAHVTTTAGPNDIDYVKQLGAEEVIDYTSQDFSQLADDYDAVFDTIGGETNQKSYNVLKSGGVLVSMVAPANNEAVSQHGISYVHQFTQANSERLTKLAELVDGGTLKVNVDKVFPFDQAAEALDYLQTGHPRGKVVIQVV